MLLSNDERNPGENIGRVPERWFECSFGDDYLRIYCHRDSDAAEEEAEAGARLLELARGARVLDLCCGNGRHIPPLAARGARVAGIDLSETLLAEARKRCGPSVLLARADMRRLPFGGSFDAVFSFFTSFGYFAREEEDRQVLAEIARVLRPRGSFLLDHMNRAWVLANLVPESRRRERDAEITERRWLSGDRSRVEKELRIVCEAGERCYFESVRLYGEDELRAMLAAAGLHVERALGDLLTGKPLSPACARMILVGSKLDQ